MFEYSGVACHQCRSGKAEDLPVGKVPGHDRQNNAQGTEGDITLSSVGGNFFISQEALGIVGKEVTVPGAFLDFGFRFGDRLAHFEDSSSRQFSLVVSQMACHAMQVFSSFSKRDCPPLTKGLLRLVQGFIDLCLTICFKCFQYLSGSWIDCLNAHLTPPV